MRLVSLACVALVLCLVGALAAGDCGQPGGVAPKGTLVICLCESAKVHHRETDDGFPYREYEGKLIPIGGGEEVTLVNDSPFIPGHEYVLSNLKGEFEYVGMIVRCVSFGGVRKS